MSECGAILVVHYHVLEPDTFPMDPTGPSPGEYTIRYRCQRIDGHGGLSPALSDQQHIGHGQDWFGDDETHEDVPAPQPRTYVQSGPFRDRIN